MRLREQYKKEIVPALKDKFKYKNVNQVPAIIKAVVNVGVGRHSKEKEYIANVEKNISKITGQKTILNKAKKSISAFKIREGMIVGVSTTIRKARMYDFVERLVKVTFPRIRDFRGISPKIIDRNGNMSIGLKEHLAFPEIKADDVDNIHGVEISIHTNATNKEEGLELFRLMGFPFTKDK